MQVQGPRSVIRAGAVRKRWLHCPVQQFAEEMVGVVVMHAQVVVAERVAIHSHT